MAWKNPPSTLGIKTLKDADTFTKKVTGEMLQGVILKSPVDTGAFRGNWRVSIGQVDYTYNKMEVDLTGGWSTISKGRALIAQSGGLGKRVFISNSLPYGIKLENGHSKNQAPYGMLAITFKSVTDKYR